MGTRDNDGVGSAVDDGDDAPPAAVAAMAVLDDVGTGAGVRTGLGRAALASCNACSDFSIFAITAL